MSVAAGPDIVEDGLVCHLDASNTRSYPGSGSTFFDATNNGLNGTIENVSIAGSGSQKYFDFSYNTNNELIEIADNSLLNYNYANWCYSVWIMRESADQSGWQQIWVKGNASYPPGRQPGVWFYNGDTTAIHATWSRSSSAQTSINKSNFDIPIGTWFNLVFQCRSGTLMLFLNGVKDTQTASISSGNPNSDSLKIGNSSGHISPNMRLGCFSVYNKSLTDAQILKNYNALKARFGL